MSIVYPLVLPNTTSFSMVRMSGISTVGSSVSPFTGKSQFQSWPNEYWEADISTKALSRAQCDEWSSFFLSLRGSLGTFFIMPDPLHLTNRGTSSTNPGTPIINGNLSANTSSLNITNASTNQTNYFFAGDFLTVGSGASKQLFKVLGNTNTDGSGNCVVDVFPRLRTALSGSEAVTVQNCTGVFRMANNEPAWTVGANSLYSTSFSIRENVV